jgi:WD40 repeat protein
MLEIAVSTETPSFTIPLQSLGNNTFMLARKAHHETLADACNSFMANNQTLTEELYSTYIDMHLNWNKSCDGLAASLKSIISENNTSHLLNELQKYSEEKNYLQTRLKMPESLLWTGDEKGVVRLYNAGNQTLVKDFGRFLDWEMSAATVSPDKKQLFVSEFGWLYQVSTKDMVDFAYKLSTELRITKDYGQISDENLTAMCVSGQCDYLFTADKQGNIKQFDIAAQEMVHQYEKAHSWWIMAMKAVPNGKFLYTACKDGHMKKLDVLQKKIVHDFGLIHSSWISAVCCTCDGQYVLTSGKLGYLKQWSVADDSLVRDYGKVHNSAIVSLESCWESKWLFSGDNAGIIKQWNLEDMTLERDFGKVHGYGLNHISVSRYDRWVFTSDRQGHLKQFSVKDGVCVRDYGKVHTKAVYKFTMRPDQL